MSDAERAEVRERFAAALSATRQEIAAGQRRGLTQNEINAEIQAARAATPLPAPRTKRA